jgi:hypothetical protein
MFVNHKNNKKCIYCNKPIKHLYNHLLISHKIKLLKILAIKNFLNNNKFSDININDFTKCITEILISQKII